MIFMDSDFLKERYFKPAGDGDFSSLGVNMLMQEDKRSAPPAYGARAALSRTASVNWNVRMSERATYISPMD